MRSDVASHREIDHGEWVEHIVTYADGGRLTYSKYKTPEVDPTSSMPLLLRPGAHYANAWFKAGREDEYIDGMKAAYGDEW